MLYTHNRDEPLGPPATSLVTISVTSYMMVTYAIVPRKEVEEGKRDLVCDLTEERGKKNDRTSPGIVDCRGETTCGRISALTSRLTVHDLRM
jgi:hypothetical protein